MQLISKFNNGFCFLLCVIDIFRKYTWVNSLEYKKEITTTNGFQKILNESNCKLNKLCVDNDSEFYNRSMKSWLQDNNIEMHSIHNKGKFAVAERIQFINT